jgi:hypothetical protein
MTQSRGISLVVSALIAGCSTAAKSGVGPARVAQAEAGSAHVDAGEGITTATRGANGDGSTELPDGGSVREAQGPVRSFGQDAQLTRQDSGSALDAGEGHDASLPKEATTTTMDAGGGDAGAVATPQVMYVGRFDFSDPLGARMGWPGTRVIAQFDGTRLAVQLTQTNGFSGGPSWFDVVIDGTPGQPFSLTGQSLVVPLASGLAPGAHVVLIEKRTEADLGTVRFEGFTFAGGTGLLPPPSRSPHRIEFISDSTIDGYGVLGDTATTCPTGDPPQYDDSRSSLAFFTASASNAEMVLSSYSGKGFTVNEDPTDTEYYEDIYPNTLPDSPTPWSFQQDIPDAVVISLGGVDMDGQSVAPAGFQSAYDAFVGTLRTRYPSAAIWLTVWSQVTDSPVATRTAMTNALQAIVGARTAAGDDRLFLYVFPEAGPADQTGCEGHATVAHEQAMAALMTSEIQTRLGW